MLTLLVPFAIATTVYFNLFIPSDQPSLLATLIKCLPVISLAGAAHVHHASLPSKSEYPRLIVYGLLASSVGDACLVWHALFPLGMVAFAVAHCFYLKAFGFQPLNLRTGLVLYALATAVLWIVLPNIKDEIIFFGMPVYSLFLVTMCWRALARMSAGDDAWSWPKVSCAFGSTLFVISDAIISFHDLQSPIKYGQLLIMSTYYAAQLGITLSVVSVNEKSRSKSGDKKSIKKNGSKSKKS